ncbi:FecCD family ABC transporter permease [Maribellus sediminis]|uniref:FecCD family ABC transporter permease n=1 Tax=Maribellus sediminis TaxID=2696285 RepID=UPI00142FDD80|nr:iron ABC transporter permease [Maribellus sediminis]
MRIRNIKWLLFLLALLLLLLVSVAVALLSGEIDLKLVDLPTILARKSGVEYAVLTKIRLPRILLAVAVGGGLSLSGAILQGIYRNPLVEPYTLGISGGAALGVSIAIVFGLNAFSFLVLPLFGFAGAIVTLFLVYFLSIKRDGLNINSMLLIGVMISFVSSSAMMFLMSTTTTDNVQNIVFWVMGSLDEPNEMLIKIALFSSLFGLILTYFFAQPLNALRLGQAKAKHLGINTALTVRILFFLASLLTGIAVSIAGVIGFVGLVIPHLIRLIIGNDYRVLLGGSFLGGAIFLVLSDTIARTIIAPNELPIGVITGLIGGVVFIVILSRSRSKFRLN